MDHLYTSALVSMLISLPGAGFAAADPLVHSGQHDPPITRTFQVDKYLPRTAAQAKVVASLDDDGLLNYREDRPLWGHSVYQFVQVTIPREASPETVMKAINHRTNLEVGDITELNRLTDATAGTAYIIAWELGDGATITAPWGRNGTIPQKSVASNGGVTPNPTASNGGVTPNPTASTRLITRLGPPSIIPLNESPIPNSRVAASVKGGSPVVVYCQTSRFGTLFYQAHNGYLSSEYIAPTVYSIPPCSQEDSWEETFTLGPWVADQTDPSRRLSVQATPNGTAYIGSDPTSLEYSNRFLMVRGLNLASGSVAIESWLFPGYYLRHQDYLVRLQSPFQTLNFPLFTKDSAFLPIDFTPFGGPSFTHYSSYNYPDRSISHLPGNEIAVVEATRDVPQARWIARHDNPNHVPGPIMRPASPPTFTAPLAWQEVTEESCNLPNGQLIFEKTVPIDPEEQKTIAIKISQTRNNIDDIRTARYVERSVSEAARFRSCNIDHRKVLYYAPTQYVHRYTAFIEKKGSSAVVPIIRLKWDSGFGDLPEPEPGS